MNGLPSTTLHVYSKEWESQTAVSQVPSPAANTASPKCPVLTQKDIDNVEKFVFFVGYPRSGHSIISSMMDAHPNMVISNEFMLLRRLTTSLWSKTRLSRAQSQRGRGINPWNKIELFQALSRASCNSVEKKLRPTKKGYTLGVGTEWQGTFNGSLKAIGDKSGGFTVMAYLKNKPQFKKVLQHLRETVGVPLRVIHVVRNPYDIIATAVLQGSGFYYQYLKGEITKEELIKKGQNKALLWPKLKRQTRYVLNLAQGVNEMMSDTALNLSVLEIHGVDFVRDPKETISRICAFIDLPCPQDYLQACYDKAYKTVSKTRNLVAWPEDAFNSVETSLKRIPFLRRYSFDD